MITKDFGSFVLECKFVFPANDPIKNGTFFVVWVPFGDAEIREVVSGRTFGSRVVRGVFLEFWAHIGQY